MTSSPDFAHLVCALDFSEGSEAALIRAADLAERFHARLHLFHTEATFRASRGGEHQADQAKDQSLVRLYEFAEEVLGGTDVLDVLGPEFVVRHGEYAADAVVRYATEVEAGLVVLGTHGRRGYQRLALGSVAESVVRHAPCPVLTVPNEAARTAPSPSRPVLVAVDFSAHSRAALQLGEQFAALFDAPIEAIHVAEDLGLVPEFYTDAGMVVAHNIPELADKAEAHLQQLVDEEGGTARPHVRFGRPHHEIVARAEEVRAGLVVMATHGLTGVKHALLGSVTERALRRSHCPVLSVRARGGR